MEFRFDKYTQECIEVIMKKGFNTKKDAVVHAIQNTAEEILKEEKQQQKK